MAAARSESSLRVMRIRCARARPAGGSRRRPSGKTWPPPNGSRASISTTSTLRASRWCWNPSSSSSTSAPKSRTSSVPVWKRSAPMPTGARPERTKICGSSPECSAFTMAPGASARCLLGRVAAVAARQDPRRAPPLFEDLGQQQHAGRFAGAAHGEVADADHRSGQLAAAGVIAPQLFPRAPSPQPRQHRGRQEPRLAGR